MAGFSVASNEHLIRSNLWSAQLKDILEDQLLGLRYVRMITDFPDGTTLNIPSIGQMEVNDYVEGQPIKYTSMDTGNFTFTIDKYQSSATYIYDKFKQDSYYMNEVQSSFVPKQARAIAVSMETNMFAKANSGQTASGLNTINGAYHRWVASGANETLTLKDFSWARYALEKANVPLSNLVAVVDPSVISVFEQQPNMLNLLTPKMQWADVVNSGMTEATGMQFQFNIFGFDVYVSNHLPASISETVASSPNGATVTTGVANCFFSATPDVMPLIGHIRQAPRVESERNKDYQRDEYVTTARWGFQLFRPENMVIVLSDDDQVYAT